MNKQLTLFVLGFFTGLAAGGVAAYVVTKKKAEAQVEEEIEAYAEYADAKIEHMKNLIADGSIDEPERESEEVKNNEGVKKYHHQDEGIASFAGRQPFGKKETEEKKMAGTWDQPTDDIVEIKDSDFVKTYADPEFGPYDKVTLDLVWTGIEEDDEWDDHLYWGYGTDNECLAMTKPEYKSLSISDILGQTWRWCNDYIDEDEGFGSFYVRNHVLHQDIECVVHDMRGTV